MRYSLASFVFFVALIASGAAFALTRSIPLAGGIALLGLYALASLRVVAEWERAVVLRAGSFSGIRGPGVIHVLPVLDTITIVIDTRVMATPFTAEQTLTRDGVPMDVDAVLFWKVTDPKRAALEVENYGRSVTWAAQTALREVIGKTGHEIVLSGRDKLDVELQSIIDGRTRPWGIIVSAVEIRDIRIPDSLQDAMSMQAQAERELQARVILGDSEVQIAAKFDEAAKAYAKNPTALHLRAMNMLYEGLKDKGALVIVPSTAVETMGLGTLTGLTSLSKEFLQQHPHVGGAEGAPPT